MPRRYAIEFRPSALKSLRRLPRNHLIRIRTAIDALAVNPRPTGARKLAGSEDFHRIRVGDYRIIYALSHARLVVCVVRVTHRKDVYRSS